MIIITLPLFIIIGILIKLDSKGPVIYVQKRIGRDGNIFNIYKFRTMVDKAHEMLEDPKLKKKYIKHYKINNDPRITKFGKILRKTVIDELPQIYNVLIGNMSIIGPRPILKEELEKYSAENQKLFISIKPGITGNWACKDRYEVSYKKRMELELDYAENYSFIFDMKIFFITIISVLIGKKNNEKL